MRRPFPLVPGPMTTSTPGTGSTFATLSGFAAIVLWSATIAVVRSLSEQVGPVTAGVGVHAVSGAVAMVVFLCSRSRRLRTLGLRPLYLFGCGALFVAYLALLYLAVGLASNRRQVLEIALLNYLWPALTLVFSVTILRRRAGLLLLPGTLLALGGVFLVLTPTGSVSWGSFRANVAANPTAYACAAAAAVCWALYSCLTRRWAGGAAEGAIVLFLPATAIVLLAMTPLVHEPRAWSLRAGAETVFLGLATYAAYGFWDVAMRKGRIVLVAAGSYLTPLLSTVVSCLYLRVMPGSQLWIGCAILVVGSVLSWRSVADE